MERWWVNIYIDEIEKLKYYKEKISTEFAKLGTYPDADSINKRLKDVDLKLSILQYYPVEEGQTFNVDRFNDTMDSIYQDLAIIYKIVYNLAIKEYENTKAYVEMKMTELESIADTYEKKMAFELGATSLGNTVLFKTDGFSYDNSRYSMVTVPLGNITVTKGAALLGFAVGTNFSVKDFFFRYEHEGKSTMVSPYEYAREYYRVPGEITNVEYSYEMPEDQVPTSMFEITNDKLTVNANNRYEIFGGKNYLSYKDKNNSTKYIEKDGAFAHSFVDKGRVTFYVLNASFISFDFNKEPISKNFKDTLIDKPKDEEEITFEFDSGFSFNCITDGVIYAVKNTGIVSDGKLYYPKPDNVKSFLIKEYGYQGKITLENVSAVIVWNYAEPPALSMVAIKETFLPEEKS